MPAPASHRTLVLAASLTLVATPLTAGRAQHAAPLPVGARVRVAAPPRSGWVVGQLSLADSDHIVLRAAPRAIPDTIPLTAVQSLEVSRGRPRVLRTATGMLIGGLTLGAVTALVTNQAVRGQEEGGYVVGFSAAGGVVVGLIVGGIVGYTTAPERWKRVPIQ